MAAAESSAIVCSSASISACSRLFSRSRNESCFTRPGFARRVEPAAVGVRAVELSVAAMPTDPAPPLTPVVPASEALPTSTAAAVAEPDDPS